MPRATGDLDHDLRRTANDCGMQALANGMGTLVQRRTAEHGTWRAHDAVAGVKQAVAPLH
jgi:hypothetical protein